MILDYIKSTIENIRERIKNPFTERNATPFAGALLSHLLFIIGIYFSLL